LKALGLLRVVTAAIDSSKLYVSGKWYENTAKVREQFKTVEGYKLFVVYEASMKVPIYLEFVPMNTANNTILAKKVKVPRSKRDKLRWLLTEVLENGVEYSAKRCSQLYAQEYNEPFNESKRKDDTVKKEPFEGEKEVIHFWITNITPQVDSAVQILDEYKNRWSIEIFFRDEKDEDHLNEFPCHSFRGIKTNLYFKFIACVILFLFKKLLTEKYRTMGLKRLRRYVIKQPAMLYYRDGNVQVDMHGKKQKARFNELRECMQESIEEIMENVSIGNDRLPVQS
jgi:hypothetical protein